jgi:predicted nucleotidyltransferase
MLSDNDIARIVDRIVRSVAPIAIGVFGSYAVGTPRAASDLDLFVIKHSSEPPAARRQAMRRLLFGILHPTDVHVFTPAEFDESVHEYLSFTWVIVRQARLYHWTEEAKRLIPSLFARPSGVP